MNADWQSLAAIAVVLTTIVIFVVRAVRRNPEKGCGMASSDCGCTKKFKSSS
ncbi:MAG: hypothetical protein HKN23_00030 [Verrucomicrobiales bacterium]|nr:hypothetical protein [Verrucomicrobiales bacterium]